MRLSVVTLLPVVVALVLVASHWSWRILRTVVTIAHEGGHVVMALLVGRRLAGTRLHADASGVALSRGRPKGPGMVATLFAGYVTPCLLGLGAAALVAAEQHALVLGTAVALLAGLLVTVRNVFGVVVIVLTGAALVVASVYAPERVQQAGASVLAWFLLFGGLRSATGLQRSRRSARSRDSDADQLARVTHLPALLWVGLFVVVAVGALAGATALLLQV